jgi:hypothetical protein
VISRETAFGPLIKGLRERKIFAQHEKALAEIPSLRVSHANSAAEKITAVVERLAVFSVMNMDGPGTMCEPMAHIFGEMYQIELEVVVGKFVDERRLVLPKN